MEIEGGASKNLRERLSRLSMNSLTSLVCFRSSENAGEDIQATRDSRLVRRKTGLELTEIRDQLATMGALSQDTPQGFR